MKRSAEETDQDVDNKKTKTGHEVGSTLYVTKLPPSLSSLQLQTLFSTFAPVRSAFVITTSSSSSVRDDFAIGANAVPLKTKDRTAQSRGFGYVKFVLRQDAEQCLQDWKRGIPDLVKEECERKEEMKGVDWNALAGLKLDLAKKKLRKDEQLAEEPVKKQGEVQKVEKKTRGNEKWAFDPNGARTVLVQGLPTTIKTDARDDNDQEDDATTTDWVKAVKHKCRKLFIPEQVSLIDLPSGEKAVSVLCNSAREAHQLIAKTHNHVLKNQVVSAITKSSWDLVERKGKSQGGRLLVRNLAFDTKEEDLRCAFAPYGALHSIHIPNVDPSPDAQTSKGFAFIHFVHRHDAEKAIEKLNATRLTAGMARERAQLEGGKLGKKKQVREQLKSKKQENGANEKGRLIAVDWALSKDEWKKAQTNGATAASVEQVSDHEESDDAASQSAEDEDEDDEEEEEDEDEDDDSDLEPIGLDDTEPIKLGEAEADEDIEEEQDQARQEKGTTLFVRNISFESTEAELYDLFKQFGPVRYARIVMDSKSNRSRGTAFVCFWNEQDAVRVKDLSDEVNELALSAKANDKNSGGKKSVLMPDPSTSKASQITLHGRVLAVSEAVSKDKADKLREDRDKKKTTEDRRNLYLMREGVIFPTNPIAKTLVPSDLDARQASYESRKALLRLNPALFISRTRLSIRQIPLYVTDGMLKRLANHAIRAFEKDPNVQKLTDEDKKDESAFARSQKDKAKDNKPVTKVKQSKILRQADRVDPLLGLARSKGYGFLELDTHANALRVLRWANANREVNSLFRKWWRDELEKSIAKEQSSQEPKEATKSSKKGAVNESAERIKRLKEKLEELQAEEQGEVKTGRSAKSLIIEFSIENAQTTKRRQEKIERAREKARRLKEQREAADQGQEDDQDRVDEREAGQGKKRKAQIGDAAQRNAKKSKGEPAEPAKLGQKIGGLIGKKRRMRKQKG